MVVQVHLRQSWWRTTWQPLLVHVVVNHHRRSRWRYAYFTETFQKNYILTFSFVSNSNWELQFWKRVGWFWETRTEKSDLKFYFLLYQLLWLIKVRVLKWLLISEKKTSWLELEFWKFINMVYYCRKDIVLGNNFYASWNIILMIILLIVMAKFQWTCDRPAIPLNAIKGRCFCELFVFLPEQRHFLRSSFFFHFQFW